MSLIEEPITSHIPDLVTERVVVRRFRLDDLQDIHHILDIDLKWGRSCEERRSILEFYIEQTSYKNPPFGYRAIVLRDSGTLIGMAGLTSYYLSPRQIRLFQEPIDKEVPPHNSLVTGIGYSLQTDFQRKGYATEAVRALVAFAFQELAVPAVWARTDHKNERSIALMKRIGMRIGIDSRPDAWPGVLGVLDSSPSALRPTGFADSGDR